MQAVIITTPAGGHDWEAQRKDVDLSKPGNIKWLNGHIKWAVKNRHTVLVAPR